MTTCSPAIYRTESKDKYNKILLILMALLVPITAHAADIPSWPGANAFSSFKECLRAAKEIRDQASEAGDRAWDIVRSAPANGPWTPNSARALYDLSSQLYDLAFDAMSSCSDAFSKVVPSEVGDGLIKENFEGYEIAKEIADTANAVRGMSSVAEFLSNGGTWENFQPSMDIKLSMRKIGIDALEAQTSHVVADALRDHLKMLDRKIEEIVSHVDEKKGNHGEIALSPQVVSSSRRGMELRQRITETRISPYSHETRIYPYSHEVDIILNGVSLRDTEQGYGDGLSTSFVDTELSWGIIVTTSDQPLDGFILISTENGYEISALDGTPGSALLGSIESNFLGISYGSSDAINSQSTENQVSTSVETIEEYDQRRTFEGQQEESLGAVSERNSPNIELAREREEWDAESEGSILEYDSGATAPGGTSSASLRDPLMEEKPPITTFRVRLGVSDGYANVRAAPGTMSDIRFSLDAGTGGIQVIGACQPSPPGGGSRPWCPIEWQGRAGWISQPSLESD